MLTKYKLVASLIFLLIAAVFILLVLHNITKTEKDTVLDATVTPAEEKINAVSSEAPTPTTAYTPSPEPEQINKLVITGIEISNRIGEKRR